MGRLEGKVAIVTGASRGIGAAIARRFAEEGAKVAITARKQEALDAVAAAINADFPEAVHAHACHSGDPTQLAELVGWTEEWLGLPTVLVNNAATNPYFGPLLNASWGAWDKTFEVNLKGYFEASRQVAKRLLAVGSPGSIVSITSILGQGPAPLQGIYGMTKAAVISMTKTFAVELGEANIRFNAIAPGLVDTRLAAAITSSDDLTRTFTDRTALKRVARPEEIAGAAVFLASDEASYVTGQVLAVDAGYM